MKRSKWKGPFINMELLTNISKKKINILSRNSTILPQFIGRTVNIYNGKRFNSIKITENMINHKFGAFSLTKQPFKYKKK